MREIYRRSEETLVCLSNPSVMDCLSWAPQVPMRTMRSRELVKKGPTLAVVMLKNILLDFLLGKGKGGDLRPIWRPTAAESNTDSENSLMLRFPLRGFSQGNGGLASFNDQFIESASSELPSSSKSWVRDTPILDIDEGNLTNSSTEEDHSISSEVFRESLRSFITNKWWRQ
jgi:hypothetical protein